MTDNDQDDPPNATAPGYCSIPCPKDDCNGRCQYQPKGHDGSHFCDTCQYTWG